MARGLKQRENAIVIATKDHREAIAAQMHQQGLDFVAACQRHQYLEWDAEEIWPRLCLGQGPTKIALLRSWVDF